MDGLSAQDNGLSAEDITTMKQARADVMGVTYVTATEVQEREKALFSRTNAKLDAATQKAFGPILDDLLTRVKDAQRTAAIRELLQQADEALEKSRGLLKGARDALTTHPATSRVSALLAEITDLLGD